MRDRLMPIAIGVRLASMRCGFGASLRGGGEG